MKKYLIGWILHIIITAAVFSFLCGLLGMIIGISYGISGKENFPTEAELTNNTLFGVFCFISMLGANFFSYYITIKKCLKHTP